MVKYRIQKIVMVLLLILLPASVLYFGGNITGNMSFDRCSYYKTRFGHASWFATWEWFNTNCAHYYDENVAVCGDGVLAAGEQCDTTSQVGCSLLGFTSGTMTCKGDCSYDTSGCSFNGTAGTPPACMETESSLIECLESLGNMQDYQVLYNDCSSNLSTCQMNLDTSEFELAICESDLEDCEESNQTTGCVNDSDCDSGYECDDGECVIIQESGIADPTILSIQFGNSNIIGDNIFVSTNTTAKNIGTADSDPCYYKLYLDGVSDSAKYYNDLEINATIFIIDSTIFSIGSHNITYSIDPFGNDSNLSNNNLTESFYVDASGTITQ